MAGGEGAVAEDLEVWEKLAVISPYEESQEEAQKQFPDQKLWEGQAVTVAQGHHGGPEEREALLTSLISNCAAPGNVCVSKDVEVPPYTGDEAGFPTSVSGQEESGSLNNQSHK